MKTTNWLLCHVHAYEYFGGVTRLLIPDNLKTGVSKKTRYETILNKSYAEILLMKMGIDAPSRNVYNYFITTSGATGGEPLLNREWRNIINYCADNGLSVILSTNGLQLDLHDEILNQVAVLSLPLDGGNLEVNSKTRSKGHFIKIRKLIDKYIEGNHQFRLKINTVLTGYNYDKLDEILMILNDSKIVWKIFELRKKGEYYQFPNDKMISDEKVKQSMLALNKIEHKSDGTYDSR